MTNKAISNMKAAQYNEFSADSNPNSITINTMPTLQAPLADRVIVKILAASLNPVDHKVHVFHWECWCV